MEIQVAAGIVVVISLGLLRLFAARRVASGHRRFVWLLYGPTLFLTMAVLWVSIQVSDRAPPLALVIAITGVIHLWLLVRLIRGTSRSLPSAGREPDLATAMAQPLAG